MIPASYARFSTDKQRPTSIADQHRGAGEFCARQGWPAPLEYADLATSAALPLASRPGAAALLADAVAGRFDVLLVESLDRLSRDLVEQERITRRLEFMGIRLIGRADGYDSSMGMRKISRIARGMVNELYIDDLRHKTHRGLAGQLERGFIASGKVFGYRIERQARGSVYVVDDAEAAIVRRIFADFGAGASVQSIAHALNAEGLRGPRGGTWCASALFGSPAKGSGVLNNRLYVGEMIWNRSQWIKDPDSGRRQRRERPREEWTVIERPELRIVDDAAWQAVRTRFQTRQRDGGIAGKGKRPTSLFGGLLRCSICGGAMVVTDGRVYGCAARKDRGPSVCAGVTVKREIVDRRMLGAVRATMLTPAAIAAYERELRALLQEQARPVDHSRRLAEIEGELSRVVDAIAAVGHSDALRARLQSIENEKAALLAAQARARQSDAEAPSVADLVSAYRETVLRLGELLASGDDIAEAREILRDLFGPLTVRQDGAEVWVESAADPAGAVTAGGGLRIGMVAGTRYPINLRFQAG